MSDTCVIKTVFVLCLIPVTGTLQFNDMSVQMLAM